MMIDRIRIILFVFLFNFHFLCSAERWLINRIINHRACHRVKKEKKKINDGRVDTIDACFDANYVKRAAEEGTAATATGTRHFQMQIRRLICTYIVWAPL